MPGSPFFFGDTDSMADSATPLNFLKQRIPELFGPSPQVPPGPAPANSNGNAIPLFDSGAPAPNTATPTDPGPAPDVAQPVRNVFTSILAAIPAAATATDKRDGTNGARP